MSDQVYNIFLIKDSVGSFGAALNPEKTVTSHPLRSGMALTGTLYVGEQNQHRPNWVELLNPFLQTPIQRALSANISAVLLIEYDRRTFALSFGHGKSLLAASSWVRDFGLKVTLNRVDPAKLRSIDTKTYEDVVLTTRRQVSQSATANSLEFDVARDLVRGVTGRPVDTTFFKRLTGADSLSLATGLEFQDLGDLLDELLVAYADTTYRRNFGWIDNVREVDPTVRDNLNTLLVQAFENRETDQMHFAPADIIDWSTIAGFNYTTGRPSITYPELDLRDYIQVLGDKIEHTTLEQLRRHRVRVRFEDSETFQDQWSVYDCLVWETMFDRKKFVLFDGRWFEVEQAYATRVTNFLNSLAIPSIALPQASLGQDEGEYNEQVAANDPVQFALLDKQTIRATGAASPIEFCDLMSNAGHLIYVKKRSSSATLSHLFSQGSVSSDAFLGDKGVRREVRAKLQRLGNLAHRTLIPSGRPNPNSFEVVYAILAKNTANFPPPLPFFSAVNLMHHATRIQNLGFKVSLLHVRQA